MQCLAGLWWDQQRRTCVLPSEVACNPYNIINSQWQSVIIENIPNSNYLWKKENFCNEFFICLVNYQPATIPLPAVDIATNVIIPTPGQGAPGINISLIFDGI